MSCESFVFFVFFFSFPRLELWNHNYLCGAGLRDIVEEYKAVISAWFFCNELMPVAVQQRRITGTVRFHEREREVSVYLSGVWLQPWRLFRVE